MSQEVKKRRNKELWFLSLGYFSAGFVGLFFIPFEIPPAFISTYLMLFGLVGAFFFKRGF